MAVFERFEQLDDETAFTAVVLEHYRDGWTALTAEVGCNPVLDEARIKLAFGAYTQTLNEIRQLLHSQNPDHYKRAAALLDALNRNEIIRELETDPDYIVSLEGNTAHGLSFDDCQFRLKFIDFYGEYCNQLMAFDLAFRCCAAYEAQIKTYSPNYLENMCHYLKAQRSINSLYMIFKSCWL
jgi:hypothetical protein